MIKVTIVIPVFNKEKYINRCVDSILNQTYKNIEIILVDDGSTDKSSVILDEYSLKYKNIRVFHKHNGGVSSARNYGILKATGERIIFVDSDDYVNSDYVSSLLHDIEADLNIINYTQIDELKNEKHQKNTDELSEKIPAKKVMELLVSTQAFEGYLWNKSFKTEIIKSNHLKFDETIKVCEDLLFCVQYAKFINFASYLHHEAYFYTSNIDSATHNYIYDITTLTAFRKIMKITNKYEECNNIIVERYMSSLLPVYFRNKKFNIKDYRFIRSEINKYRWKLKPKHKLLYVIYPAFCIKNILQKY